MHRYSSTLGHAMRDVEGAARSHTSRGCAAHAVHSRRPSGERTGNAASLKVLVPDADKLWDSLSERSTDARLDDDVLVDRVAEALAERHPQSRRRGRLGTPAAVVLRLLVLKHLRTSARCEAAWSTARFAASTVSASRTRRR